MGGEDRNTSEIRRPESIAGYQVRCIRLMRRVFWESVKAIVPESEPNGYEDQGNGTAILRLKRDASDLAASWFQQTYQPEDIQLMSLIAFM